MPMATCKVKNSLITYNIVTHSEIFYFLDLISYAKTAVRPIRLVVIDYAGLTTSPQDLFDFMS